MKNKVFLIALALVCGWLFASDSDSALWEKQLRAYKLHKGTGSEAQIQESGEAIGEQPPVLGEASSEKSFSKEYSVFIVFAVFLAVIGFSIWLFVYLLLSWKEREDRSNAAKVPKFSLDEGWTFESDRQGTEIRGVITNIGLVSIVRLRVYFNLFDDKGVLLGTASDFIQEICPGQKWAFVAKASGKHAQQVEPTSFECYQSQAEEPTVFWWVGFSV